MDEVFVRHESFDIQPSKSMTVIHTSLKDALALVDGEYRPALSEVETAACSGRWASTRLVALSNTKSGW